MSRSDTFLFELYTEEIPSFYQKKMIESWDARLEALLKENLLEFSRVEVGGTSRRVYVLIHELSANQTSEKKKLKGPPREVCLKNDQPTNALSGFAKKAGVKIEEVRFEDIDGGVYAVADSVAGGKSVLEILPGIFEGLIKTQGFPRTMRWSDLSITYARPIIHYLAVYGSTPVKFQSGIWDILGFSEKPVGHFILSPGHLDLREASMYPVLLGQSGIMVNPEARRQEIIKMLRAAAGKDQPILNEELLDEVNFLVECPVVIRGSFPHDFLLMPEIVIISEMEEHQKYFGLRNASGKLSSDFLIVANADKNDAEALDNIRRGNEKVLRARLSDGSYFFHEDRKKKLIERVEDLKRIVFHEGMGSIFDKKERIKKIANILSEYIYPGVKREKMHRACDLIKADLTTHLVYEFDHLQGEIGSVYAAMDGEDEEISQSIMEHYLPKNVNDRFPGSKMGLLLSIADKIDNIISGHILGKQPTASQDPLGLRRQTLYIIDMLIQNRISMSFGKIMESILEIYSAAKPDRGEIAKSIGEFFTVRLATIFEKDGFDKVLINAALGTKADNIYEMYLKLDSLRSIKDDARFTSIMTAFKRMYNIVNDYQQKNKGIVLQKEVDKSLFESGKSQELKLYEIATTLSDMTGKITAKDRSEYEQIWSYLASVKPEIDDFFDHIMVMHSDEKIKMNRLSLLGKTADSVRDMFNLEMIK